MDKGRQGQIRRQEWIKGRQEETGAFGSALVPALWAGESTWITL